MSACNSSVEEFLKLDIIKVVCEVGLAAEQYYVRTAQFLSHYAGLTKKSALLRVWYLSQNISFRYSFMCIT